MTKQEEIREGIYYTILNNFGQKTEILTTKLVGYLHSKGLVIKVEDGVDSEEVPCGVPCDKCEAVEPLIKG